MNLNFGITSIGTVYIIIVAQKDRGRIAALPTLVAGTGGGIISSRIL